MATFAFAYTFTTFRPWMMKGISSGPIINIFQATFFMTRCLRFVGKRPNLTVYKRVG